MQWFGRENNDNVRLHEGVYIASSVSACPGGVGEVSFSPLHCPAALFTKTDVQLPSLKHRKMHFTTLLSRLITQSVLLLASPMLYLDLWKSQLVTSAFIGSSWRNRRKTAHSGKDGILTATSLKHLSPGENMFNGVDSCVWKSDKKRQAFDGICFQLLFLFYYCNSKQGSSITGCINHMSSWRLHPVLLSFTVLNELLLVMRYHI